MDGEVKREAERDGAPDTDAGGAHGGGGGGGDGSGDGWRHWRGVVCDVEGVVYCCEVGMRGIVGVCGVEGEE